ncbi:hypothetical protein [Pseudoalteromonas sp. OF7H-1]|uniref:hypothetical protein n=1 Tax=Pseudoalteromonas sp. OF7H-1 TaxID=2917755 RepID=UPI001EF69EC8|nr:hypothetical protein [Pseudoalteromonas sp. OF7H-1]MCG7540105.1 hypothetical protein [Pseudoalteromonas sp. OF7H-1]
MKNYKLTLLSSFLTLTLSACGDSSSNDTGKIGGGTKPATQTISLNTYQHQCGKDTGVSTDIVFHDANGKPVGTAKTNSSGTFSGELPKGTMHLSVIGDVKDRDLEEFKQIYTELDISQRKNLGNFYFQNYSENCGCSVYNIDKSELTGDYANASIRYGSSTFLRDSVTICPDITELYITATAPFINLGKAAIIEVPTDSNTIKLSNSDFVYDGLAIEPISWTNAEFMSTRGYLKSQKRYVFGNAVSGQSADPMYIFPTLTDVNFLNQYITESTSVNSVDINFYIRAQNSVENDGNYMLTQLPEISPNLFDDLLAASNSSDTNYDFSSTDERLARARWGFSFLVDDAAETRFDWDIEGGIRGEIPDLSFGEVFPEPEGQVDLEVLSIYLYGYEGQAVDNKSFSALLDEKWNNDLRDDSKFDNFVSMQVVANLDTAY